MKIVLIGSSNVNRFIEYLDKDEKKLTDIRKCTKLESFKVQMNELEETDGWVLLTVIENFVCDAVNEASGDNKIKDGVAKALSDFIEMVKATATRLPETKFAIVEPMSRPAVDWWTEDLTAFTKSYSEALAGLQLINISTIKRADLPSQLFDDDGIHLTNAMGSQFLKAIIYFAEKIFEAPVVDLETEQDRMDTDGEPTASGSGVVLTKTPVEQVKVPSTIQEQFDDINRDIKRRRHYDSMVTARIREEMDHLINVKKENKLIVTGLNSQTAMPTDKVAAKKWMDELVGAALDYLSKDSSKGMAFVMPGRKLEKGVPTMFEVRMKERELAVKLRKDFSACMRDKPQMQADGFGRMFVANSVTLATRVRSDILKVIAGKCSNDREDFFVIGFTSRPVLSVRRKDKSGQYALTYVDAVAKYGGNLSRGELQVAYGRAGESFVGQLQQNFVVLHDKGEGKGNVEAAHKGGSGPAMVGGKKRGIEEVDTTSAKRQDWKGARGTMRGGAMRGNARGKPKN